MSKGNWREFDDKAETDKPASALSSLDKLQRRVRVQRTRGGKGGKTVTLISGLELDDVGARNLLKVLKSRCGTGGTVKKEFLELQGDQIIGALVILKELGYRPKQSGG